MNLNMNLEYTDRLQSNQSLQAGARCKSDIEFSRNAFGAHHNRC
jgi:hypothetical protein